LEAVRQNGLALEFTDIQTNEMCIEAILQNYLAIKFVTRQYQEICIKIINQNKKVKKLYNKHLNKTRFGFAMIIMQRIFV